MPSISHISTSDTDRNSRSKSGDEMISLKEYVDRMKEGQSDIYYMQGESVPQVSSPPFLENLRKRGLEVLYMADPVHEYALQQLKEFVGNKLKAMTHSICKGVARVS